MFDNAAINNSPEMLFEGHDVDTDGNKGNVLGISAVGGIAGYFENSTMMSCRHQKSGAIYL